MSYPVYKRSNENNSFSQFDTPPRAPPSPPRSKFNTSTPNVTTRSISLDRHVSSEKPVLVELEAHDDPLMSVYEKCVKLIAETWIIEIISMLLSVAALVGLVVLLWYYDGQEYPRFTSDITLNTILSVSVTVMVAALTMPISSGLGQLKWIKAQKGPVRLSQINLIDQGSRGVWGSLLVICTWSGGFVGALGALVFILTLLVAPLSQQAILFSPQQALSRSSRAFITACNGSNGLSNQGRRGLDGLYTFQNNSSLPTVMRGAYYNALYGNFDNTSVSADFASCSTGNCTWQPFATLGIQSTCRNVTEFLQFETNEDPAKSRLFLPDGPSLPRTLLYNSSRTGPSSRMPDSNTTAVRFAAIESTETDYNAIECDLSFSVQVIEASITNGRLRERVMKTYIDSVQAPGPSNNSLGYLFNPPEPAEPPFERPIYVDAFDPIWVSSAISFLGARGGSVDLSADTRVIIELGNTNLTSRMDDLSVAMSRAFRVVASGSNRISGATWTTLNIVQIDWYWLVGSFVVELLGLVFFLGMVILNTRSGTKLWKTILLATFFHGPQLAELKQPLYTKGVNRMYGMETEAEKMKVILLGNKYATQISRLVEQ